MTRGVSVVIPTRDRRVKLAAGLAAVAQAAAACPEPVEVIVLDDAEDPRVAALLDELPVGVRHRYVPGHEYGGHAPLAGRNHGVSVAAHDLIAFTDDDTVCRADWLSRGVERLRSGPACVGVEGAVLPPSTPPQDTVRARVVVNRDGGGYLTANLFARREDVLASGGFKTLWDPAGPVPRLHFREDSDMARRLRRRGDVPFDPELVVLHPIDAPTVRTHLRTACFFVLEEAYARLHPDAVPSIRDAPLARVRIRAATAAAGLVPLLAPRRTRRPALAGIVVAAALVALQVEGDLRAARVPRSPADIAGDTLRRLPRSLAWALTAGAARIVGWLAIRSGVVKLRPERPAS